MKSETLKLSALITALVLALSYIAHVHTTYDVLVHNDGKTLVCDSLYKWRLAIDCVDRETGEKHWMYSVLFADDWEYIPEQ